MILKQLNRPASRRRFNKQTYISGKTCRTNSIILRMSFRLFLPYALKKQKRTTRVLRIYSKKLKKSER